MTEDQARDAGAADPKLESRGHAFEIISPVLSGLPGLKSVAEVMTALKSLGIQAGPSAGIHVHVNVGKTDVDLFAGKRGSNLAAKQILNVWAHYARFQLVINEMLQDSRIGNRYAHPLLFSDHRTVNRAGHSQDGWLPFSEDFQRNKYDVAKAVRQTYANLQSYATKYSYRRGTAFCSSIMPEAMGGGAFTRVCAQRYPKARYFQLNLVPLDRLGTIEFRAFPASNDPERVLRWVLFVLKFVEHYKDDDRFVGAPVDVLETAQLDASMDDLEAELSMDLQFFRERPWLNGTACRSRTETSGDDEQEQTAIQEEWENGKNLPSEIVDNDDDDDDSD